MIHKEIHAVREVLTMYSEGAQGRSTLCAIAQGKLKMKKKHRLIFRAKRIVFILAAVWFVYQICF